MAARGRAWWERWLKTPAYKRMWESENFHFSRKWDNWAQYEKDFAAITAMMKVLWRRNGRFFEGFQWPIKK